MAEKLYIIDGHAHIYSSYFAPMRSRLTSPAGEPTKATYIFTTVLLSLLKNYEPDMLVVAMDSKVPSFRTEIYPEYKAHRPPMPDDMPPQIDRIEQILKAMQIPILRLDGFEADDIIGTLSTKAAKKGHQVFICSKDKDMLQLVSEKIKTLDLKTGTITGLEEMKQQLDMTPEQFLDVLALQGDTSDNIPGCPDVGPKTALQWIQKFGSIENLYENIDEIKGKRGNNLREHKDDVYLSRKLVEIDREVPIDIDYENFRLQKPNEKELAQIFAELDFSRLITQMGLKIEESQQSPKTCEKDKPEKKSSNKDDLAGQTAASKTDGFDNINTTKHSYHLIDSEEKLIKLAEKLKTLDEFAFDTETTSVQACRAELVGMSFSWQSGEAFYIPVKGPLGSRPVSLNAVKKHIGPIMAESSIRKIGQNIKYDLIVMANAEMPVKGVSFDTMVADYVIAADRMSHSMDNMARDYLNYDPIPIKALLGRGKNQLTFDLVDPVIASDYACEDADLTWRLYEYLKVRLANDPELRKLFDELEMPLVFVLTEMERVGVKLDTRVLKKMSIEIGAQIEQLRDRIYEMSGSTFNLDSPKQLGQILFDKLGLKSVRSGKTGRSTDAAVLEQLKDEHEAVQLILEYRQLAKLQNTYVDKLGQLINPKTQRVHASFNQTVTVTGRLSSSDPNLQNIPIRTELGRKIRSAFVPGNDEQLILAADYSQIELRLLAHFSRDPALCDAFANDRDIHSFVAHQIFSVPIEEVTSEMRSQCKAVNFGIIYGQGPFGLSKTIGISQAQARDFINDYFRRYSAIKAFMEQTVQLARKRGYAQTILGRRRTVTGLNSRNNNKRSQAERLVVNTTIQGSAADLIKVAMINIHEKIQNEYPQVNMILQIHDELVFEIPADNAEKHREWISSEMENAIKVDVPMKVDVSIGKSWLEEK